MDAVVSVLAESSRFGHRCIVFGLHFLLLDCIAQCGITSCRVVLGGIALGGIASGSIAFAWATLLWFSWHCPGTDDVFIGLCSIVLDVVQFGCFAK